MSDGLLALFILAVVAIVAMVVYGFKREIKNIHIGDIRTGVGDVATGQATIKKRWEPHLYQLTFAPPPLAIIGTLLVMVEPPLALVGEVLLWIAATLIIPATIGEVKRPGSVLCRAVLILNIVFFIFLVMESLAAPFPTVGVVIGMSLAIIAFAMAAAGQ